MRTIADEAAEEMSQHLAEETARASVANARLAEATAAQAAEVERIRTETAEAIARHRETIPDTSPARG